MQTGHLNELKQPFRAFNEQQTSDLLEPFQMSDDRPGACGAVAAAEAAECWWLCLR